MSDQTSQRQDDESFSFGLAELRRAAQARSSAANPESASRMTRSRLQIDKPRVSGFDPYNSTGGFDRNNAWNRIRKR